MESTSDSKSNTVCKAQPGLVMNIVCTVCNEELPITKPLRISTMTAVMAAFDGAHKHEPVTPE